MNMNVGNLDTVVDKFALIPAGTYTVLVHKAEAGQTQSKGIPKIDFQLKILSNGDGTASPFDERIIFFTLMECLDPNTGLVADWVLGRVKNMAASAGINPTEINENTFLGQVMTIKTKTKHDDYKGEEVCEIQKWITKAGGAVGPGHCWQPSLPAHPGRTATAPRIGGHSVATPRRHRRGSCRYHSPPSPPA